MRADDVPQSNIDTLFSFLYNLLTGGGGDSGLILVLRLIWDTINTVAVFTAPLLLFGIIYTVIRTQQMHKDEKERFQIEVEKVKGSSRGSDRWQRIVDLVSSNNPIEWRQGVIDADVMLDELLTANGYMGDSLGEKLKSVSSSALRTIDAAWEAHKVRNQIAHAGSDFILTQREARRAIDFYRQVFAELGAL